jgi:hypothetical protein
MRYRFASLLAAIALLAIVSALTLRPLSAADPPAVSAAGPDGKAADEQSLREQTIYVPYDKLRQVFEQSGRGVFLPYEKFQELWQAARRATLRPADAKAPVGAVITAIESEATAAKDVVRVRARLTIEVLNPGWHEVPLRLGDSAITAATLGKEPARIVGDAEKGYTLLVESKDKKPGTLELTLEYAKAINRSPGQNSVEFAAPEAPLNRWQVRIPEAGVKVNIQPLVAISEAPAEPSRDGKASESGKHLGNARPPVAEETVLLAFVGATRTVRIDWTPKAEGATGMAALVNVESQQQVSIGEGVSRTHAKLTYAISRAQLGQLLLEVPADQKVVNVLDANVRQWSVEPAGKLQKITVQLFEPAKDTQALAVDLERFAEAKAGTALEVPVVKALGVGRQQGVVVVELGEGLRAEVLRTTGLLQLDQADLPPGMDRGKWTFSYRYAALPYELALAIEKVQPRILVDSLLAAYLEPERLSLDWTIVFHIERAGVFQWELEVPPGYDVRRVEGCEAPGASAASVDAFHLEGEKKNRLIVSLAHKAIGNVGLNVELQRDLQEPSLLTPSDKAAEIRLPLPRVALGATLHTSGRLLFLAPESLRVNPGKSPGLRPIGLNEGLETIRFRRPDKLPQLRAVLAFAHTEDSAVLVFDAQRRKPQTTLAQLLVARIEDGVVRYQDSLFYNVQYSGVKSLRIDVPKEIAGRLRNNTRGIREKEISPPPKDLSPGCVAWSLTGESELMGAGRIDLTWEDDQGIGKLEIGKSVELALPRLVPKDVDRAWGQIVLAKAETIELDQAGEPVCLRPIDPQHDLMPGAAVAGGAAAFEFHGDWALRVLATRYKLEEVKHTSIERAVVRMVVTPAEQVSVQALYRMRSGQQRLELELPENVQFDTEPLRIDGRVVGIERGQQGRLFVPLVNSRPDEPMLLELRYTLPGSGRHLDLPYFPSEPAVQKVYLCVYLPLDRVLLGKSGAWTDEVDRESADSLPLAQGGPASEDTLLKWVLGDRPLPGGSPTERFHTDGKLYVFSTLQPEGPPRGSLRLFFLKAGWFTGLLLGGMVALGVLLLPAPARIRILAIGLAVIVLAVCMMFWPLAAREVMGPHLWDAALVVAAIWTTWWCGWALPGYRTSLAARLRKVPAEPVSPPESPAGTSESKPEDPPVGSEGGASHE